MKYKTISVIIECIFCMYVHMLTMLILVRNKKVLETDAVPVLPCLRIIQL